MMGEKTYFGEVSGILFGDFEFGMPTLCSSRNVKKAIEYLLLDENSGLEL